MATMGSMLETIVADARLSDRLARLSPDDQTRTLEFSGPFGEDSIGGKPPEHGKLDVKPLEGFVPRRPIVSLGQSADATLSNDVEYRLVGKLGSGGTAIVFQAHQRAIDREVAVKVLRDDLSDDPEHRRRFLTEARVIGALDHPNVIALHDLCIDDDGHLFYSMKRIDGASWDEQIDELGIEANIDILLRVADAIRYAHSRGLIHRDLKPENVMLGRFGEVLVADWGLAMGVDGTTMAPSDDAGWRARWTGSAVGGTPAYMAPEQAAGQLSDVTRSTDIYLLGALLYRILTGHPPHRGKSLLSCIQAAANNEISTAPETSPWIGVAMKAMSTEPTDRHLDVEAFMDAVSQQRLHTESDRLVKRALRYLEPTDVQEKEADTNSRPSDANPYQPFRTAEALLRESLEVWPDNESAKRHLTKVQIDFARLTASRGDYDLSLLLYRAAGEADSEAAARVRRQRDRRSELNRDRAKYSALFTKSPDAGILIRWQDGQILEVNEAFRRLLGYTDEMMVGESISALSLWACPERRARFVDAMKRDGQVDNFEAQFIRYDANAASSLTPSANRGQAGSECIDVLLSSRRVELGGQELALSTIRDISQRKSAERDLQQSRRRLRDLQRLAGLGSWSYNVVDQTVTWSDEAFRVAGRSVQRGEPSYEEFIESIHPDDRVSIDTAIHNAIDVSASYVMRMRMQDESGQYRRVLTRGQPVTNDAGNVVEVYGILMPATFSSDPSTDSVNSS
ncbi:MAG: protein kinase [Planctomycetota bacterium]